MHKESDAAHREALGGVEAEHAHEQLQPVRRRRAVLAARERR
jgi:hypothetical protein